MADIEPHITARAVVALSAFGGADLDRETAARLIRGWKHWHDLSGPDVEEVLRNFPLGEPDPLERPQPSGGMISGPSMDGRS
jgi:hypothetical protein